MGSQVRQVLVALPIPAGDDELGGNINEIGGQQFVPDKHVAAAHQVTDRFSAPNLVCAISGVVRFLPADTQYANGSSQL